MKAGFSDEETQKVTTEAHTKFSLKGWLEDSSHRAQQLSYTTHPSKFSHPDAKINHFIADKEKRDDGLLRSGNAGSILDVVGNAACLDVHKFLSIILSNQLSIMDNFLQDTKEIRLLIEAEKLDYKSIRGAYLKIQENGQTDQSSTKLKQVYFPVTSSTDEETNYHLLSLLTSSSILYELKNHISQEINFSEQNKQARKTRKDEGGKKEAEFSLQINEIKGLTEIGFGGSQPQNISYTNSQNGGIAFLLNSMPPSLARRKVQLPKTSFYQNTLKYKAFKELFSDLNKAINTPIARINTDKMRDGIIREIFYHIHQVAKDVRRVDGGWSNSLTYENLPQWQKIYLDSANSELRVDEEKNANYQQECIKSSVKWIRNTYDKQFKENLGDDELKHFTTVITDLQYILS